MSAFLIKRLKTELLLCFVQYKYMEIATFAAVQHPPLTYSSMTTKYTRGATTSLGYHPVTHQHEILK